MTGILSGNKNLLSVFATNVSVVQFGERGGGGGGGVCARAVLMATRTNTPVRSCIDLQAICNFPTSFPKRLWNMYSGGGSTTQGIFVRILLPHSHEYVCIHNDQEDKQPS